jgi:hypothetical protein
MGRKAQSQGFRRVQIYVCVSVAAESPHQLEKSCSKLSATPLVIEREIEHLDQTLYEAFEQAKIIPAPH